MTLFESNLTNLFIIYLNFTITFKQQVKQYKQNQVLLLNKVYLLVKICYNKAFVVFVIMANASDQQIPNGQLIELIWILTIFLVHGHNM